MDNVARVPWPNGFNPTYSENRGKEKLPFLILVFATMFITLCKFYAEKLKFSYKDVKYRHLFLKTRRSYNRHKMLLIVPKSYFLPSMSLPWVNYKNNSPLFSTISKLWVQNNFFHMTIFHLLTIRVWWGPICLSMHFQN